MIGARTVLTLQTIVSRENNPRDPAVVTVRSFQGGLQNNVIPDEVRLLLTVRTYRPEVRKRILASIERIAKAEALAGGATREPSIVIKPTANAVYNDPGLTARVTTRLREAFGPEAVVEIPPKMVFEDFAEFARSGVPSLLISVGAVDKEKFAEAQKSGTVPPGTHSSLWAPDYRRRHPGGRQGRNGDDIRSVPAIVCFG